MASQVQICNLALTKLGSERILSLSDNNKQARTLSAIYDELRDDELRRHLWNFAMTRTSLPADAATPAWGFDFQYSLPAACLRLVQVNDLFLPLGRSDYSDILGVPFQLEGRKILTDLSAPLKIRYLQRITDTNLHDPSFNNVLATRLAMEACEDITQSNTKKESLRGDYRDAIAAARSADALENPPQPIAEDPWEIARR
jgi:hypothetical protein